MRTKDQANSDVIDLEERRRLQVEKALDESGLFTNEYWENRALHAMLCCEDVTGQWNVDVALQEYERAVRNEEQGTTLPGHVSFSSIKASNLVNRLFQVQLKLAEFDSPPPVFRRLYRFWELQEQYADDPDGFIEALQRDREEAELPFCVFCAGGCKCHLRDHL
ncbi:MAG: hypothetical protein AAF483_26545 [Planctomycetota bacterium]